jgi:hypothetical protein
MPTYYIYSTRNYEADCLIYYSTVTVECNEWIPQIIFIHFIILNVFKAFIGPSDSLFKQINDFGKFVFAIEILKGTGERRIKNVA